MFVQHTHRGIEKGKHGRKENERIMAVINDGRTGNDLSTGGRRGVDFAGHKRGGMKGDVCVHVKGPRRTRWVCKVVAVAGTRERGRTAEPIAEK